MKHLILIALLIPALANASPIIVDPNAGKYLGNLNDNGFDPNSVANEFGRYGNEFSPDSINNDFGKYGNEFSTDSINGRTIVDDDFETD